MRQGTISVETGDIFPIIKKFLYSESEIFIRELVSNAVDATQKVKTLSSLGELKGEIGELKINVSINKDAKTIIISDNGIGMTEEEVDKYINQIAFSGARDFVNKYQKAGDNKLIGYFGLGFYSSFIVSKQVDIITKSYKDAPAVKWSCDGSPEFTIEPAQRAERGTDIVLHITDDSKEFLDEFKIKELLKKYCGFLPIPIFFKDEQINNTKPAWTISPNELKDEDYEKFYKELYPFTFEKPLFQIHLNVDYPFNLTGILYFPKLNERLEVQKNKIRLYSNQVYVSDNVEGIVPDFLTLLHGVIDSPDIPLNVSRSYLQSDSNVKKISNHIVKKVADKLQELYKNNREEFNKKWDDIRLFITYGMVTDDKFYERVSSFALFKNTSNEYFTMEEYMKKIEANQTNKDGKKVILYTNNREAHYTQISAANKRGYDVLIFDSPLDAHYINMLESKNENVIFARIDSDTLDKLVAKVETVSSKLTESQQKEIKLLFEELVSKEKFNITFEPLSEGDMPVSITQSEFMRRMMEMQALGGGGMMGVFPESYNLVVNANHPLMTKVLLNSDKEESKKKLAQAIDLAKLSANLLKGEELTKFIERNLENLK